MLKKLISMVVLIVMVFSFVACGTTGEIDWQAKLDELNAKMETQNGKIADFEENIAELEENIAELENYSAEQQKKIAELEKENARKADMIADLEEELETLMGSGLQSSEGVVVGGDPASGVYAMYKTRTTTFDIDKVKIILYYGIIGTVGLENQGYSPDVRSIATITAWSGAGREIGRNHHNENGILLKEIDDFTTDEYILGCAPSKFSHFKIHETFTIPEDIFVGEMGWFGISIWERTLNEDGRVSGSAGSGEINLYYKVTEGTVTLSTTWFKE